MEEERLVSSRLFGRDKMEVPDDFLQKQSQNSRQELRARSQPVQNEYAVRRERQQIQMFGCEGPGRCSSQWLPVVGMWGLQRQKSFLLALPWRRREIAGQ